MELEALERKQAADNEINWVTAGFMVAFHLGAVAALFFFTWKALFVARCFCGGFPAAWASAWATTAC